MSTPGSPPRRGMYARPLMQLIPDCLCAGWSHCDCLPPVWTHHPDPAAAPEWPWITGTKPEGQQHD